MNPALMKNEINLKLCFNLVGVGGDSVSGLCVGLREKVSGFVILVTGLHG